MVDIDLFESSFDIYLHLFLDNGVEALSNVAMKFLPRIYPFVA